MFHFDLFKGLAMQWFYLFVLFTRAAKNLITWHKTSIFSNFSNLMLYAIYITVHLIDL